MQLAIRAGRPTACAILVALALVALRLATPASAEAARVPGVLGVDHMGVTVTNVAQARRWFTRIIGCRAPLRFGPFADPTGPLMKNLLDVHPRAVVEHINVLRCGTGSSIELLQYKAPRQDRRLARNSDLAGHHVAFYVTDLPRAVAYMRARGVQSFKGPFPVDEGPAAGQSITYFRTPFGLYVELISYPGGMAYERTATTTLWNPADVGARPSGRGVPGLLGVDHFGLTVLDVAAARRWFGRVFGCRAPLAFGPFGDPTGTLMKDLVDVHPRAVIDRIEVLRCGANGANLELMQYRSPDQRRRVPRNSDLAANHVAIYVRNIKRAVAAMPRRGVRKLLGPFDVTDGPAAGQSINYFLPPIGHFVELISYPRGMAYERTARTRLWSPRRPRG
jgi:catechol 2,3-dioxygenase-like lactoylglutathione lyase family enzyme